MRPRELNAVLDRINSGFNRHRKTGGCILELDNSNHSGDCIIRAVLDRAAHRRRVVLDVVVKGLQSERFLAIGGDRNQNLKVFVAHRQQVRRETRCHRQNYKDDCAARDDRGDKKSLMCIHSRKAEIDVEFLVFGGGHMYFNNNAG